MVVVYDKANTLRLSYAEKVGERTITKFYKFLPGRNEISGEIWEKIKKAVLARPSGEDQWDHYERYLKVVEAEETEDGGIDYSTMKSSDLADLVSNTMELNTLAEMESCENSRKKPRKVVLDAIEKQRKEIEDFQQQVENSEE
jgi:hypothetical protein